MQTAVISMVVIASAALISRAGWLFLPGRAGAGGRQ